MKEMSFKSGVKGQGSNVPSKLRGCAAAQLGKLCRAAVLKFRARLGDCNVTNTAYDQENW